MVFVCSPVGTTKNHGFFHGSSELRATTLRALKANSAWTSKALCSCKFHGEEMALLKHAGTEAQNEKKPPGFSEPKVESQAQEWLIVINSD